MDTSSISRASSPDPNCYESIVDENTSMYYSFNETLKEQKSNISQVQQINNDDEDSIESNIPTVVKKNIEKSTTTNTSLIHKNLLKFRTFSSHTSTPTQSPKIQMNENINNHQQQQEFEGNGNISGVIPLLEQQNSEMKFEKNFCSSTNSFQLSSITSSLHEFVKFEKIIEQQQQKTENVEEIIDELIIDLNLSKISVDENDHNDDANKNDDVEFLMTPTPYKMEIDEDIRSPIIVIVPPSDECEKFLGIENKKENYSMENNKKSLIFENNENEDEMEDENKENVDVLANVSNSKNMSRKSLTKSKINTENQIDIVKECNLVRNNSMKNKQEESYSSMFSGSDSSSVLKTTIQKIECNASPSMQKEKDESSAKESDANAENIARYKEVKKVRRSIRLSKDSKKSIIEETDTSSDANSYNNKNEKFQKLSADNKKKLRRPSSVHFAKPCKNVVDNKPDLLANVLPDEMIQKTKSIKPQTTSVGSSSNIDKKHQDLKETKKNEGQANIQQQEQKQISEKVSNAENKRKTIYKIPVIANKRLSIKDTKPTDNNSKLVKPKTRVTQVFKTTLNSSSIVRRSVLGVKPSRKSLIPVNLNNKPSASVSTSIAKPVTTKNAQPSTSTAAVSATTVTAGEKFKIPPPTLFTCHICHTSFKIKSKFESHKKTHDVFNICEYCDKSFAFAKALNNHQMENCSKIPPFNKKKLVQAAIKMKHEEQLLRIPRSFQSYSLSSNPSSVSSLSSSKEGLQVSTITEASSCDEKDSLRNFLLPKNAQLARSSSAKKRKNKLPFSGIYRTPSKPIKCYKCKKNFMDVAVYTEHTLSHSSSMSSPGNVTEEK